MMEEKHEHKEELKRETKRKPQKNQITKYLLGAAVIQIVLLIFIAVQISGMGDLTLTGAAAAEPIPTAKAEAPPTPTAQVSVDDDYVLGNADAPVTIIEFSDFQCSFCARLYSDAILQIKEKYVKTGKVKFVFRDFPLDFHKEAQPAAIAANCAGEQGKYYEFHDKIFENQGSLGGDSYRRWAGEIGLDVAMWQSCLTDPKQVEEIRKDIRDGAAAGVRGTPATFVNGKMVSGAQPFSVFAQLIEAELAKG